MKIIPLARTLQNVFLYNNVHSVCGSADIKTILCLMPDVFQDCISNVPKSTKLAYEGILRNLL